MVKVNIHNDLFLLRGLKKGENSQILVGPSTGLRNHYLTNKDQLQNYIPMSLTTLKWYCIKLERRRKEIHPC